MILVIKQLGWRVAYFATGVMAFGLMVLNALFI